MILPACREALSVWKKRVWKKGVTFEITLEEEPGGTVPSIIPGWSVVSTPISQLRRIDQLCDRFEKAWRDGVGCRIEDYLTGTNGEERIALLRALLAIELELKKMRAADVSREAYRQRFPREWERFRDLFADVDLPHQPASPIAEPNMAAPAALTPGQVPTTGCIVLEVVEGPHRGARFEFDRHDTFLVGRSSAAHLRVNGDPHFSRNHFRLEVNPPQCFLVDLGSRNGTFVNKKRVTEVFLSHGDVVSGGRTVMHVTISGLAETIPPPPEGVSPPMPPAAPAAAFRAMLTPVDQTPEIAGYDVKEEIGRGALGRVYRAIHKSTEKEYAVKVMAPAQVAGEKSLQMFIREAGIHTKLDHPHIVKSHEMGLSGGLFFLAMECVRHQEFADLFGTATIALRQQAASIIACQILEALDYTHARGLVHRDVKPANILLTKAGRRVHSRLADFGLAKQYADAGFSQISRDGDVAGSLPYMSPEQLIDSRYAKPACDVYGLGATLYWYLSGTTPHDFSKSTCKIRTVLEAPIVPLQKRCPQIPAGLARIVHRSLARDPAERYGSAAEMRHALASFAKRPA